MPSQHSNQQVEQRGDQQQRVAARKGRILVVDDFPFDREILSMGLSERQHQVLSAETGDDALEIVEKQPVDLILLDSQMPGMDGIEVLTSVRQKYSALELPVIMVTGMGHSESVVEALRLGANDYVTKPVDLDVIAARIDTQLSVLHLRAALQQEQEFSLSLIESAYEIIIATDMNGIVTLFNQAAEEAFGYAREEIVGQHHAILFEDVEDANRVLETTVALDRFTGEVRNRRRSGDVFHARLAAAVQRDKNGHPIGIVGLGWDMTEAKALEAERDRLIKAKEEFLAIATHDLQNPLTSIMGFAGILEEMLRPGRTSTEQTHDCLVSIKDSARKMQKIIQDFIDFQTMNQTGLWVTRDPVDLGSLAKEVVESNREYARRKEITLHTHVHEGLPPVMADGDRIERVLRNLVSNAIKFSHKGCEVHVEVKAEENGSVRVAVVDNGPGLAPDDLPRAFQKYQRLSNKPTGGEKSTGLGLSICKQLVDQHGGQIGVCNNPDRGATFWFVLPAG